MGNTADYALCFPGTALDRSCVRVTLVGGTVLRLVYQIEHGLQERESERRGLPVPPAAQ